MLLSLLPVAFESLAIRVVDDALTTTLIIFELTFVCLTIWPHVGAITLLLALHKVTKVETSIRPLEQALAMHCVVDEGTLINLAS